ncbi:MAG: DoxX family protein [Vampirovibrionales bacterium]
MSFLRQTYLLENTRLSIALLALRAVVGVAFIFHGFPKFQHAFSWLDGAGIPPLLQALAAFSEFGGGIALVLGLFTPLASLGILLTMSVAMGLVHFPAGHPFVASEPHAPSYELALVYWIIALVLLLTGPAKYSLDYFIVKYLVSSKTE